MVLQKHKARRLWYVPNSLSIASHALDTLLQIQTAYSKFPINNQLPTQSSNQSASQSAKPTPFKQTKRRTSSSNPSFFWNHHKTIELEKSHQQNKMMHMTFYWGRKVTLLFDFWKTDSWISYAFTLLACLLFSIFYQYMEDRRLRFKLLSLNKTSPQTTPVGNSTPLLYTKPQKLSAARFAGAILFGVNSAIGYLLMLAIMSFNGGVFVAVVLGLAVGYLLFKTGDEDVLVVDNSCACA